MAQEIPADVITPDEQTREAMKSYWETHASDGKPTNDTMMLMNNASQIDAAERREILELLPDIDNMRLIELGCGIGRFTGTLAERASSVIAVDFIQKFLDENIKQNKGLDNIDFRCEDVTKIQIPSQSLDVVFSNWLMMYLNDNETENLARNMNAWVKPGGYVMFRESCQGGPSGDKPRLVNPTFYRPHYHYTQLFSSLGLLLVKCCLVECYVTMKSKTNQYVWVFKKQE